MYSLKIAGENQHYYFGAAHTTNIQMLPGLSQEDLKEFRELKSDFDQVMVTFE